MKDDQYDISQVMYLSDMWCVKKNMISNGLKNNPLGSKYKTPTLKFEINLTLNCWFKANLLHNVQSSMRFTGT